MTFIFFKDSIDGFHLALIIIHICRCHTHIETYYTWCLNTTSILKCAVP